MLALDETDRRIVAVLDQTPRATVQYIAHALSLARGTVQARVGRLIESGVLGLTSTRLQPAALARPLRALVTAEVDQAQFDGLLDDISGVPEVVECLAISGQSDIWLEIVAVDADDVYRITQQLMGLRGIRRTVTSLVLRELMPRRMSQLL
jgi:DNA-binding Lrp family transcriptional regulator